MWTIPFIILTLICIPMWFQGYKTIQIVDEDLKQKYGEGLYLLEKVWIIFSHPFFLLYTMYKAKVQFENKVTKMVETSEKWEKNSKIYEVNSIEGFRSLVSTKLLEPGRIRFVMTDEGNPTSAMINLTKPIEVHCNDMVIDLGEVIFITELLPAFLLHGNNNYITDGIFAYPPEYNNIVVSSSHNETVNSIFKFNPENFNLLANIQIFPFKFPIN